MRKREAEAIVSDIINELRNIAPFRVWWDDDMEEEGYYAYEIETKLVKIVMDEE